MLVMLRAIAFADAGETPIDSPELISEAVKRGDSLVWVDLLDPTDEDFCWIEQEFKLHPLSIEEARRRGQRPKLERYETHTFLVTYGGATHDVTDLPELGMFVGPGWLVTLRSTNESGSSFDIEPCLQRFRRTKSHDDGDEVGFLLYSILDEVVLSYFPAIERIEDEIEVLEGDIFMGEQDAESEIQRVLLGLRRELIELRRRVVPLRDVVMAILRQEIDAIDRHHLVYFDEVLSHLLRAIEEIDNQRELLGNAVEAHLSTQANRMNVIMKKMTSWGAILLCATIVTGIYGMNFDNIPLLHNDVGYVLMLIMMAVITFGGYAYFKRKGWL